MSTVMDRRVKERLVGATILVVLIVLIVPELLSGPDRLPSPPPSVSLPVPTRNVSVDLTTSRATPTPQSADVVPPSSAVKPAEGPGAPPSVTTLGAQAAAGSGLETRSSTAKSAVSNEAQPAPARDSWSVQLGSFSSKANADKLVHQLKARGLSAYVISSGSGSAARFRVRMGPMPDREAAEREVDKLKAMGHVATIVAPAS
ncbi:MAG TPA: SPOR domain-containing protein [Steroidobacteraceae bacterium]|nr:SPOR domain-containing protein [Steroidobacteraceae bacterium]